MHRKRDPHQTDIIRFHVGFSRFRVVSRELVSFPFTGLGFHLLSKIVSNGALRFLGYTPTHAPWKRSSER